MSHVHECNVNVHANILILQFHINIFVVLHEIIRLMLVYKRAMFHRKYCNYSNVSGYPLYNFHDNWGTIRNTAFTHSSKKAWNNFWHFSARSSLIIWPAFGFVPCSTRSIFWNKLLLQSYNNNVLSVPSNTRSTRAVSEFSREMLYHVIIFAPPGSNPILAFRCWHYNWSNCTTNSGQSFSSFLFEGHGIMLRSD